MNAKRAGKCQCGALVKPGDKIYWNPTAGRFGEIGACPSCQREDAPYMDCGTRAAGYSDGEVRVFSPYRAKFLGHFRASNDRVTAYTTIGTRQVWEMFPATDAGRVAAGQWIFNTYQD